MIRPRAYLAAGVLVLAGLSACSYEIVRPQTYGSSGVAMLHDYPRNAAYTSLGVRGWSFYRPGFAEPGLADVWDDLSSKVAALGGNACLIQYQRVSSLSARSMDVTCEVLKVAPATTPQPVR